VPEPITIVTIGGGILGVTGHLARRHFDAAKEVADIVLGTIALVVALPIIAVCAVIIKLSGRGPVFYTQVRAGRDGKPFTMYKLRTMYPDAESASGAVWAQRDDPRIMPACRWMRRSHVDELPQILNVIRGEMSLVGPRPERVEILAELAEHYPDAWKRLAVRPGITGLAQVSHGYDTSVDEFRNKLQADLEYIERRRWSLEIQILARTLTKLNDREAH
jgi:lipopolysaccharide/colanic/teichoic acid biosynthesis glycosyltransferase